MNHGTKSRAAVVLPIALALCLAGCAAVGSIGKAGMNNPASDATIYEKYGLQIAIPNEYANRLLAFTEHNNEHYEGSFLISVYEKQSYEESRADYGGESALGYLFGICRYTRAQYEAFLCSDGSGLSFFAKDNSYYYGHTFATDVQFYRSGTEPCDEDVFGPWTELSEQVDGILSEFTSRNGLIPYSDSEFFDRDFTYDGEHLYVTYYPYYAGNGSRNGTYTLVLSQPAKQGEGGIWCVERWYDNDYGSLYHYFPSWNDGTDLAAAEYYAQLQTECDNGHRPELPDPVQAAMKFATEHFGHTPVSDSFAVVNGEPAGNVLSLCCQVFDDMGNLQAATYVNGQAGTREQYDVPEYLTPFGNFARSSFHVYLWLKAEEPAIKTGDVLFCRSNDGSKMLSFYQQDSLLCVNVGGKNQWFRPAYAYNTIKPYDRMYGYYDEFSRYENDTARHG